MHSQGVRHSQAMLNSHVCTKMYWAPSNSNKYKMNRVDTNDSPYKVSITITTMMKAQEAYFTQA